MEDTHALLHSLNMASPFILKKSGLGLREPPEDHAWHGVLVMELADNKLSELPLSPSSPELKVLFLQGNAELTRIPNAFFIKMPNLLILDLSYTSVRDLPDSLFELELLREMYLKGCECFMRLPPKIGKLKKLEKLDLEGTQIIHLPKEIEELTNLQSLFLCFYEYRGRQGKQYTSSIIIPTEVISRLKGLKHLSIDVNPDDERWYSNIQDILGEILGLEHLLTLSLYIPHLELLQFIPDRIFQIDFRFIVGRHMQRIISSTPSSCKEKFKQSGCSLKFVNGGHVPNEIKRVVRHSKALFVERHKTIKNLSEFEMVNLEQLRVCVLAECREMQTVVDGKQVDRDNDIFSHLLYLYISHMKSLRSIWKGHKAPPFCFGMLKSLVLQNCPELTTVFTKDFLGNLSLLKELIVKDCPKITTLISDESFKPEQEIFLPKLRKIMLLHLPELINIANGGWIGPSLNIMAIYDCPKIQSFSKFELSSPNMKLIKGEIKWWNQVQWSKEEWGTLQRPSKFDCIFSSIDNLDDLMSQFWIDNDIDDDTDAMPLKTLFEQDVGITNRMNFAVPREMSELKEFCLDDGFKWRKLGQEIIVGSKNPSHYYVCAFDDCPVRKRVKQSEEDPTMIEIIYKGTHTHRYPQSSQAESLDDGYSWRKYGEKVIPGVKYPIGYYRCDHSRTQGCIAKKKVQRDDKEPFLIHTYNSYLHTCTKASIITNPSMNKQDYTSIQSGVVNNDVHYHPGGNGSETLQSSDVTNCSVSDQVDVMTQFGLNNMDDSSDHYTGIVDDPLTPSNDEVIMDGQHAHKRVDVPRWKAPCILPITDSVIESLDDGYSWRNEAELSIKMDQSKDIPTGKSLRRELQGPHPAPLRIHKVSPKIISTTPDNFMSVVQHLTGSSSSTQSSCVTTPPTLIYSVNHSSKSASDSDFESFCSKGPQIEPSANETSVYNVATELELPSFASL